MSVIQITRAVGHAASNRNADVTKVQVVLNHFIGNTKLVGVKPLIVDGKIGPKTNGAIMAFQIQNGLLSEEHFNGQIRPQGMTIRFMNNHAGYIPPSPKTKKRTTEANVREAIEYIKKSHGLTKSEESTWETILTGIWKKEFGVDGDPISGIGAASNVQKWLDFALDVVSILKSTGLSFQAGGIIGSASSLSWSIGTALGVFGPFLTFVGFVRDLDEVMKTDRRIYEAIAIAYGTTYWAYGGIKPRQSKTFLDNWRTAPEQNRSPIDDMQFHWNRGLHAAVDGLDAQTWKYSREAGMLFLDARRAMRAMLRTVGKTTLTRTTLKAIESKFREKGEINKASGVSSWMNKIVYPL